MAAAVICQGTAARAQTGATLEYQVKAAYVLNFLSFTQWPARAFSGAGVPLRICLAGGDPFGGTLDSTVKGETISGHPVVVERLAATQPARECHALFVSAGQTAQAGDLLRAVDGAPVLTIGESGSFLRSGGMVNLVIDGGNVRFDVNRQQAEKMGLTFSSRLLRLARSVT